ncbi:hypothetical protein [Bacillus canaveralius]|uniref:hypothetical protein n=1 Tax=Bacillus canaveralius TaxID=1403243 RepID=UPI0015E096B9|nr:hypothetical protein [Bacillus canaveralius]
MRNSKDRISLPGNLRGRSIHLNVIPTVCNLRNMLEKLIAANGDVSQLRQWDKRSFNAYQIEKIKLDIMFSTPEHRIELLKKHILSLHPNEIGASCIDIYLVAFVAQRYGAGKQRFFEYVKRSGISDKENSAHAIWQVGKGDGVYLGILNNDGTVRDWEFFEQWINGS